MEYSTTLTEKEPIVITIGNFDGIHKGHQSLMQATCDLATQLDSCPVLLTFQPHTLAVVRPEIDLQCLTTLEEKLALVRASGIIRDTIVLAFTPAVAAMSASAFLDDLRSHFHVRGLVVGENFSLGNKRMGDVTFLQQYGQTHDIEVRAIPLAEIQEQRISSTRIRALVAEGDVLAASELLGHPCLLHGIVALGDQRGRLLGFPTANILPPPGKLIPANGVYAGRVFVRNREELSDQDHSPNVYIDAKIDYHQRSESELWNVYTGAINIGVRPTFDGQRRLVEAHLLDQTGLDLYGQYISIHFLARLRSEQRFAGIDALKAQIAEDVRQARHILQYAEETSC
jgi:riboflavin kinase/FMN adenylyltransferase